MAAATVVARSAAIAAARSAAAIAVVRMAEAVAARMAAAIVIAVPRTARRAHRHLIQARHHTAPKVAATATRRPQVHTAAVLPPRNAPTIAALHTATEQLRAAWATATLDAPQVPQAAPEAIAKATEQHLDTITPATLTVPTVPWPTHHAQATKAWEVPKAHLCPSQRPDAPDTAWPVAPTTTPPLCVRTHPCQTACATCAPHLTSTTPYITA